MTQFSFDICAIGNAIVDIAADVSEEFLAQHHISRSGMTLVDATSMSKIRKSLKLARAVHAGGTASNVAAGLVSFGGKAVFLGKIAFDEVGHLFFNDMQKLGIHFPSTSAKEEGLTTGLCLSLVSSGARRSLVTYLGASLEFSIQDINLDCIQAAPVTYLEGYMLDFPGTSQALHFAADMARKAGRKVALALCHPTCVERNRADFQALIQTKIDILLANEKELMMLYKTFNLDIAIAHLKEHVPLAVITRSEKGSLVVSAARQHVCAAEPVTNVIDKTGAGDLFAAGFLFGLVRGFDLDGCARLGSIAAAEIISHYGPRPLHSLSEIAREKGVAL